MAGERLLRDSTIAGRFNCWQEYDSLSEVVAVFEVNCV